MLARLPILLGLTASIATAQAPAAGAGPVPTSVPQSAPVRELRYEITFDRSTAERRVVRVVTHFATDGQAPVVLSLPAWTPGAYEVTPSRSG